MFSGKWKWENIYFILIHSQNFFSISKSLWFTRSFTLGWSWHCFLLDYWLEKAYILSLQNRVLRNRWWIMPLMWENENDVFSGSLFYPRYLSSCYQYDREFIAYQWYVWLSKAVRFQSLNVGFPSPYGLWVLGRDTCVTGGGNGLSQLNVGSCSLMCLFWLIVSTIDIYWASG